MAMIPAERRLARYKAAMDRTLRDRATITRTGQPCDCRLEDGLRADPVPGMPRMMRLRRMRLILKDEPDVRGGDIIPVATASGAPRGSYFVMDLGTPRTNAQWTEVYCVQTIDRFGRPSFPVTATVDIYDPNDESRWIHNLDVLIFPAAQESEVTPVAVQYDCALWVPKGTHYPSTSDEPQPGDRMKWSELQRSVALSEKHPVLQPVEALAFYFRFDSDARP